MIRTISILLGKLILVGLLIIALRWIIAKPSHNRPWREDYATLPTVTWTSTTTATLSGVRDWVFTSDQFPKEQPYTAKHIDTESLKQAWFMVEPFSSWSAVAHTFFVFEFQDGSTVVTSIEARREIGEEYSITKGLLPYFEYMYVWSTERDMYTNTTVFARDKLYKYPLTISLESQKFLLKRLLTRTHELENHPRFYNLLTSNCSSLLAREANNIKPGSVPHHYSWILTGYADTYLHSLGFIPNDLTFEETERNAEITKLIEDAIRAGKLSSEKEFSNAVQKAK